jgi:hypothetical protein
MFRPMLLQKCLRLEGNATKNSERLRRTNNVAFATAECAPLLSLPPLWCATAVRQPLLRAQHARTHHHPNPYATQSLPPPTSASQPFLRPAPRVTDRHGEATHKTRPYTARARDVLRTPLSHALFYVRPSSLFADAPRPVRGSSPAAAHTDALSGALAPRYPLSIRSHR